MPLNKPLLILIAVAKAVELLAKKLLGLDKPG